jgi:hypothetical protein
MYAEGLYPIMTCTLSRMCRQGRRQMNTGMNSVAWQLATAWAQTQ